MFVHFHVLFVTWNKYNHWIWILPVSLLMLTWVAMNTIRRVKPYLLEGALGIVCPLSEKWYNRHISNKSMKKYYIPFQIQNQPKNQVLLHFCNAVLSFFWLKVTQYDLKSMKLNVSANKHWFWIQILYMVSFGLCMYAILESPC